MFRRLCTKSLIVFVLLVAATAARAQQQPPQPFGVFAKIDVESASKQCLREHPQQDVHQCLQNIYTKVLRNEAVSGLTIGLYWNRLSKTTHCEPIKCYDFGGYDWSWLDDVFAVAGPQGRPVQLLFTAGFVSPEWVLKNLIPCDTLFSQGSAPKDCGSLEFSAYPGQPHTPGTILPLPWPSSSNYTSFYLSQWTKFLGDLKNHVLQSQYPASLVAISVVGPTSASSEIIMPTSADNAQLAVAPSEDVDDAWNRVIAHGLGTVFTQNETNTDQPFIDAWTQMFHAYSKTFSGLTLILTPDLGDKLPEYRVPWITPDAPYTALFYNICTEFAAGGPYPLSCYAKTQILTNFAIASESSSQAAIQVGGMSASSTLKSGDIGLPAVKCFATFSCVRPLLNFIPGLGFVGGAEFDYAATIDNSSKQQELGCPTAPEKACLDLTPELIAFNVFADFFDSTQGEGEFMGIANNEIADAAGTSSPHYGQYKAGFQSIQYVDVPYNDILYANENKCPSKWNKYIHWMSMQDVLKIANYYLHIINEYSAQLPQATCPNGPNG